MILSLKFFPGSYGLLEIKLDVCSNLFREMIKIQQKKVGWGIDIYWPSLVGFSFGS